MIERLPTEEEAVEELMEEVLSEVHEGNWEAALAYITREIESAPDAVAPRRVRAGVYEQMQRYEESKPLHAKISGY